MPNSAGPLVPGVAANADAGHIHANGSKHFGSAAKRLLRMRLCLKKSAAILAWGILLVVNAGRRAAFDSRGRGCCRARRCFAIIGQKSEKYRKYLFLYIYYSVTYKLW